MYLWVFLFSLFVCAFTWPLVGYITRGIAIVMSIWALKLLIESIINGWQF